MADCEANICQNEYRLRDLEKDMERNQTTHKEFFKRFEKLGVQMAGYEHDVSYMTNTLSQISQDVKEIKDKPTKRYETIVACIITTIVGTVVGFIMSGVLPI